MIKGSSFWDNKVCQDLVTVSVDGEDLSYFTNEQTPYQSLRATAIRQPHDVGLIDTNGSEFTFGRLLECTDRFAAYLLTVVQPGARIALVLNTSVDFAVAYFAASRVSCVVVAISVKARPEELRQKLTASHPQLLIIEDDVECGTALDGFDGKVLKVSSGEGGALAEYSDSLGKAAFERASGQLTTISVDMDADALVMFTSGTTAASKQVVLKNRAIAHAAEAYIRVLGLSSSDSTVLSVPIFYVTGLVAVLTVFVKVGGLVVLHKRFHAYETLAEIKRRNLSFFHASPTVFAKLLEKKNEFSELPSLRMVCCGAAHMPETRIAALHKWLPRLDFRTVYGLTETSSPAFVMPQGAESSPYKGSSGLLIPGLDAKICDFAGQEVAPGNTGDIWLRGTNVLDRYEGTDGTAGPHVEWLDTGDVGYLNTCGYLFVVGRSKEMINRGGEKVWCCDVEENLRKCTGVQDVAVAGIADELYGEVPVAAIVPCGVGFDLGQVKEELKKYLQRFQMPVQYRVIEEIPTNANAKVDRKAVARLFVSASE
jgi:fatty-acyl-CoA synthase/long-chain acyl-CoA synthetase